MGIGGADVVLNDEPRSATDGDGVEAWMVEFERARPIEAAHESSNQLLVVRMQAVGVSAGHDLLGALRGKTIERLVQIHQETVQAIMLAAGHGGKRGNLGLGYPFLAETEACPAGSEAIGSIARAGISAICRLDHRLHVGNERL